MTLRPRRPPLGPAVFGSWMVMRSTPIWGEDSAGYGAVEGGGPIEKLVARQRQGWRILLIGCTL